jgi:hypothetical protein
MGCKNREKRLEKVLLRGEIGEEKKGPLWKQKAV